MSMVKLTTIYSVRSCEQHMLSWDVQLYCIRKKPCRALHMFSSYQRSKKRPIVMLSFSFKLHQLKHRWNIWWITHITLKKCAYLLKNLHTWSALHSILLKGAALNLAILDMPFLPCQHSHLVQPLLKMYTEQSLKWVRWSQLLYSVRSCEQHMLSRDVQLHSVRNKKAFICQKKQKLRDTTYCFHLIKDPINVQLSCYLFFFKLHQLKHRWNIWWITHITFLKCAWVLQNIHTW